MMGWNTVLLQQDFSVNTKCKERDIGEQKSTESLWACGGVVVIWHWQSKPNKGPSRPPASNSWPPQSHLNHYLPGLFLRRSHSAPQLYLPADGQWSITIDRGICVWEAPRGRICQGWGVIRYACAEASRKCRGGRPSRTQTKGHFVIVLDYFTLLTVGAG